MWNLKHDIRSSKFYELFINTELKGDTDLNLRVFYNNIKIYLNAVTRIQEELLPYYNSIKRHSEFEFTVSCYPIESNQIYPGYYIRPNNEPNFKLYLEKYFEKNID